MASAKLPLDQRGEPIQVLAPNPDAVLSLNIQSTAQTGSLPTSPGEIVRVAASKSCFIKFGDGSVPAVGGTDSLFPQGAELFKIPAGCTHLSVVADGAVTGVLTVTHMV